MRQRVVVAICVVGFAVLAAVGYRMRGGVGGGRGEPVSLIDDGPPADAIPAADSTKPATDESLDTGGVLSGKPREERPSMGVGSIFRKP